MGQRSAFICHPSNGSPDCICCSYLPQIFYHHCAFHDHANRFGNVISESIRYETVYWYKHCHPIISGDMLTLESVPSEPWFALSRPVSRLPQRLGTTSTSKEPRDLTKGAPNTPTCHFLIFNAAYYLQRFSKSSYQKTISLRPASDSVAVVSF
jgi:hypothetical protein